WDLRAHPSRIMTIDIDILAQWAELFDPPETPSSQACMVRALTTEHLNVLATLARGESRMADTKYWRSSGWMEHVARQEEYTVWRTMTADSWDELVLQGPHFYVATPFAKQPNENCNHNQDYRSWDLETL